MTLNVNKLYYTKSDLLRFDLKEKIFKYMLFIKEASKQHDILRSE